MRAGRRTMSRGRGGSLLRRLTDPLTFTFLSQNLSGTVLSRSKHSSAACLRFVHTLDDRYSDVLVSSTCEREAVARVKRNDKYVWSRPNRVVISLMSQIKSARNRVEMERVLEGGASHLVGPTAWHWLPLLDELARGSEPLLVLEVFNWKKKQVQQVTSPKEYTKLISLAGRINQLSLAQELFDEMPARGVRKISPVYNALIDAYGKNNRVHQALILFNGMKKSEDCQPNLVTYNTLISLFSRNQSVEQMESMLQECLNAGFSPDKVTFNALIWGYMRSTDYKKMEDAYRKLVESGCQPDIITFNALVIGYSNAGSISKMEDALNDLQKLGLQVNALIGKCMMEAYSRHGMLDKMEELLQVMIKKLVRYGSSVHSIMIETYAQAGNLDSVITSIIRMLKNNNHFRSSTTLEVVIKACHDQSAYEHLNIILELVKGSGWVFTSSTYKKLISKYADEKMFDKLEETIRDMEVAGSKPSMEILHILFHAYEKAGKTVEAMGVQDKIQRHKIQEALAPKQNLKID